MDCHDSLIIKQARARLPWSARKTVRGGSTGLAGLLMALAILPFSLAAQPFHLPTANRAIFEAGGEDRFYAPTPGRTWTSGTFGCVRTEGWQMHEGIDIRSIQQDKRGEPTDPILATADGMVTYVNHRAGLSSYGKYIVIRHIIEGMEIYSLYAHLSEIRRHLNYGVRVKCGEIIGVMGRTANTRQAIGKDRAHLHFELVFLVNDHFPAWFKKNRPGERNDHSAYNGQNLVGLDPRRIFLEQRALGGAFSLRRFVQGQTELCRVLVRATGFTWLKRQPALIVLNPDLGQQPIGGYELVLDYNGVPFRVIPRAASDFTGVSKVKLLSVNGPEYDRHPCRKLVTRKGQSWELTSRGQTWLDLITYH